MHNIAGFLQGCLLRQPHLENRQESLGGSHIPFLFIPGRYLATHLVWHISRYLVYFMYFCRRAISLVMRTNIENSTLRKTSRCGQLCAHLGMIPGITERAPPSWEGLCTLNAGVNNQAFQQFWHQLFAQHYDRASPERHTPP